MIQIILSCKLFIAREEKSNEALMSCHVDIIEPFGIVQ